MTTILRRSAIVLSLVAGLVAAGMLYAQKSGGMGGMMGMMSMMESCPMMQAMHQSPQAVLEQREALGLTASQVQQLVTLRKTSPAPMEMMHRMHALHEQIETATAGETFDEARVRAAMERMGELHTEMGVAMLRTRHEVRRILTPEQRAKLQEMGGGMHGMMGMMKDCPMMKGGMMHGGMKGMMHGSSPEGGTR